MSTISSAPAGSKIHGSAAAQPVGSVSVGTYAHPEVLVDVAWAKANLTNPSVKFVEVDVDTKAYDVGHIPRAVALNWQTELQDQVRRDIIGRDQFEELLSRKGIANHDTVVLYGDNNNWFAAYAFWLFKHYGHEDVRLLNGGRVKWLAGESLPLTPERPNVSPTRYRVVGVNESLRARLVDVIEVARGEPGYRKANLVDVRSTDEFTGKVIAPPGMTETAQRGGHVPGAASVPWAKAVNADGTFKAAIELKRLYLEEAKVNPEKPTIAYCRIGERSSHTWFVLKYLLGLPHVRNYDGSWTEYGSVIGVPIER